MSRLGHQALHKSLQLAAKVQKFDKSEIVSNNVQAHSQGVSDQLTFPQIRSGSYTCHLVNLTLKCTIW